MYKPLFWGSVPWIVLRMLHRKRMVTKQQMSSWLDLVLFSCCLVSLPFLCDSIKMSQLSNSVTWWFRGRSLLLYLWLKQHFMVSTLPLL